MLGTGWNFLHIGSSTLLTYTHTAAEKTRAQDINDMAIFPAGLTCSFSASGLPDSLGGKEMTLTLLPWLLLCTMALL